MVKKASESLTRPPAISITSEEIARINAVKHHDPGMVLGKHYGEPGEVARSLIPDASSVKIEDTGQVMRQIKGSHIFECSGSRDSIPARFRVSWKDLNGIEHCRYEPYCFPVQISETDLDQFSAGKHPQAYRFLGSHFISVEGIDGVLFATWAPNAERISVVGDFNQWDGRWHAMRNRGKSGIWEIFIPGIKAGMIYKFEIRTRNKNEIVIKTDPYACQFEKRPATAAIITAENRYEWSDSKWIDALKDNDCLHSPMSVYELHLGSWKRSSEGEFLNYRELAEQLMPYIKELGFTHIELLPITEHPLDASWGYQSTGFYAPTSRFGTPDDFRYFVDCCHNNDIAVILDWVAGHFPKDAHGMARFDGTALYEHEDVRRGEHREWGTLIFNYDRNEVRNFLISNAHYWIENFHIDGLRVDAVAAMLYLDYSRDEGEWIANEHGGNENLEAIEFIRELNGSVLSRHPGVVMIAEESTSWPQVTRPAWLGGLGFSMKWNMGWMHDTLAYMKKDPVHRQYEHDHLTFGMLYAFHENFVLPFSHDEVVHGKGSMINKMPGDDWQRFANLRLLYAYMFSYPGKKLLFMGDEFAQWQEWDHDKSLDWGLLNYPLHAGIRTLLSDLNNLYKTYTALYYHDFDSEGFEWIDCHDAPQSTISYIRKCGDEKIIVILNFTPVPRHGYRLGVEDSGNYTELLNSDSAHYGGGDIGNKGEIRTETIPWMGKSHSIVVTLPPLAGLIFRYTS
ncbi:MAG: 1,4-alpha-glucan branching enzyme [Gammaproteobacteria bacterium]|jgi:1,4-alpha-glucan branching enzyme